MPTYARSFARPNVDILVVIQRNLRRSSRRVSKEKGRIGPRRDRRRKHGGAQGELTQLQHYKQISRMSFAQTMHCGAYYGSHRNAQVATPGTVERLRVDLGAWCKWRARSRMRSPAVELLEWLSEHCTLESLLLSWRLRSSLGISTRRLLSLRVRVHIPSERDGHSRDQVTS